MIRLAPKLMLIGRPQMRAGHPHHLTDRAVLGCRLCMRTFNEQMAKLQRLDAAGWTPPPGDGVA